MELRLIGCGMPLARMVHRDGLRVERLRSGFWLAVADKAVQPGTFALQGTDSPVLMALCPLRSAQGVGSGAVTVWVAHNGPLPEVGEDGGVILAMNTILLRQILGEDFETLPPCAMRVVSGVAEKSLQIQRTAEHMLAAAAIRSCDHTGAVRNVYMKSKALELLSLVFSGLKLRAQTPCCTPLSVSEIERMTRARDMLLTRFEDPPSLAELAAAVGVCETRLKQRFKQVFGLPPHGMLRRHRMIVARDLLIRRRVRVSEAASAVGYTNVSHFIDAFVRQYGVRPGELVRTGGASVLQAVGD